MGLVVVLIQLIVPTGLLLALALLRQPSRLRWGLTVLAFGLLVGFLGLTSRWELTSVHLRPLLALGFIAASASGYRRIQAPFVPPSRWATAVGYTSVLFVLVLGAGLMWRTVRGFTTPEGQVLELATPLKNGSFVVLNGGTSPFLNAHAKVAPQNYALDIVGLNAWGRHASFVGASRALSAYAIYNAPVYAPCSGTIAAVEHRHPDLIPPNTDPAHPAGNYVLLNCEEIEVLLAHLKPGSIRVRIGEPVKQGVHLGNVGNSGNTSEPHLHLHAERGGAPGILLNGLAVPIRIDNRLLVRGSRLP
ncbi:MAG: M23 family metallopeptidase [Rhodothermales bacterium]